ncbi:hypothetical protein SAMN05660485_03616 [Blastococcus fimeti]|nr:hypothetical protein SAMN05660485_03616 [Blastococcus fimeti]
MGGVVGAATGHRDRVLAALLGLWLVAASLAAVVAVRSAWPPLGELPTAEQVQHARSAARVAGIVAVCPPAVGLLLARRWQAPGWIVTCLVGLMVAVLGTGLLLALTDNPVRG